jgi:ribosomal protein S19
MSRSSFILPSFIGLVFEVYTGKSYTKVYIEEKMVGHKLGEFSYTRKIGKIHFKKGKTSKVGKK